MQMSKAITLQGAKRSSVGKGLYALRQAGKIPAIVYGPGMEALPVELDGREATRVLNGISSSSLIQLTVDKKEYSVLVRDIQRDSIRLDILHVDLYAVPSDREIRVRVPLTFVGVSSAVRDFGGILVHVMTDLEVECLPKDLVNEIRVDITPLDKIGSAITIKDVTLPPGVKVLMDEDENVVTVTAQREEEEEPVVAEAAVPAEVEVIEKGKKLEEGEEEEAEEAPKEGREAKK
jgi:large subunit ribosomal protein L25